jgi:hypothetical protein
MKTPAEYVDAQLAGPERPATLTFAEAEAAVTQALEDAARYKDNLVRALRSFAGPGVQTYLDQVEPVADSGTIEVGGQVLPWRVTERLTIAANPSGENPPF